MRQRSSKIVRRFALVVLAMTSVFYSSTSTVWALSKLQKNTIDSGALYYNVEDNFCAPSSSALLTGGDLDTASLEKIRTLLPVYEKHAKRIGIPWQILAAKHYRETGLSLNNPANGQGVWQLYSLVTGGSQFFPENPNVSVEEFDRQTGIMVDWFFVGNKLEKARSHTLTELQYIFTTYNGWGGVAKKLAFYNAKRAGVSVDELNSDELLNWNAYSMNQYDSQHADMIAKVKDDSISVAEASAAAQRLIDTGSSGDPRIGTNKAIGAVPIYLKLGGPVSGGAGTVTSSPAATFTTTPASGITKLYIIGDSLTVGMRDYLATKVGNSLVGPVEATSGISIESSVPKVTITADTDTALVGLGTNNFSNTPAVFKSKVEEMVAKLRSTSPNIVIYWVNIYAPRANIESKVGALNATLVEIQASDPKFKVVDWEAEARKGGYTFPDELHPTETTKRADFILSAIGALSGQQTATASSCGGSAGGGAVAGSIVQTATNFAWFEKEKIDLIRASNYSGCDMRADPAGCGRESLANGAPIGENDAKPAFVAAVKQFNPGNDSDGSNWAYSDCGVFVATTVRASGADPQYAARTTSVQMDYVKSSAKYEIIPLTDTALLKPGDILIKDGHTRIYIGPNTLNPSADVAESSWGDHVPAMLYKATIGYTNVNDGSAAPYIIARLK